MQSLWELLRKFLWEFLRRYPWSSFSYVFCKSFMNFVNSAFWYSVSDFFVKSSGISWRKYLLKIHAKHLCDLSNNAAIVFGNSYEICFTTFCNKFLWNISHANIFKMYFFSFFFIFLVIILEHFRHFLGKVLREFIRIFL